jgi:hypothetical protein
MRVSLQTHASYESPCGVDKRSPHFLLKDIFNLVIQIVKFDLFRITPETIIAGLIAIVHTGTTGVTEASFIKTCSAKVSQTGTLDLCYQTSMLYASKKDAIMHYPYAPLSQC